MRNAKLRSPPTEDAPSGPFRLLNVQHPNMPTLKSDHPEEPASLDLGLLAHRPLIPFFLARPLALLLSVPVLTDVHDMPGEALSHHLALECSGYDAKAEDRENTYANDYAKPGPELCDGELHALKLTGEVGGHDRDGHEEESRFTKEEGDAGESFDGQRFLDGNQVEVLRKISPVLKRKGDSRNSPP